MKNKYIYLLKYIINISCEWKFKAFSTLEAAHEFHAQYKQNTAAAGFAGREIEHYEIVCVPFDIRTADEPGFYDNDASADTDIGFKPSNDAVHSEAYEGVL